MDILSLTAHRRWWTGLVLAALVATAAGYGVSLLDSPPPSATKAPIVSSIRLSLHWGFDALGVIRGTPTLFAATGNPAEGPTRCALVAIGYDPLRTTTWRSLPCDAAWEGSGEVTLVDGAGDSARGFDALRLAITDPYTEQVHLGPVLMTVPLSGSLHPSFFEGYGHAWLYDPATPIGAELLRLDATTGAIEARLAMPRIIRPTMAADSSGLYIGITPGGGSPGGSPIYFVGSHSQRAVLAWRGGDSAFWSASDDAHVYFEVSYINQAGSSPRLLGFDGAVLRPALDVAVHGSGGLGPALVGAAESLWSVGWPFTDASQLDCGPAQIVRADSTSGLVTVVANLRSAMVNRFGGCENLGVDQIAIVGGRLYVLSGESGLENTLGQRLSVLESGD